MNYAFSQVAFSKLIEMLSVAQIFRKAKVHMNYVTEGSGELVNEKG